MLNDFTRAILVTLFIIWLLISGVVVGLILSFSLAILSILMGWAYPFEFLNLIFGFMIAGGLCTSIVAYKFLFVDQFTSKR
jgi:hypothetical protein